MPISYNTDLFSVPSHNRQKEMKKEKSVQIARPARKPSTESEVDPLLAQIQEKSAKVRILTDEIAFMAKILAIILVHSTLQNFWLIWILGGTKTGSAEETGPSDN